MVKENKAITHTNALQLQPPSLFWRLGQDLVLRLLGRLLFSFYSPFRH